MKALRWIEKIDNSAVPLGRPGAMMLGIIGLIAGLVVKLVIFG